MDNNLTLYNLVKSVPQNAQKEIKGGRLKGMTDINPMWRIKTLTEQFGVCGFGWKYEIIDKQIINGSNEEKAAFVTINLYIKVNDEWSDAIQGTGGSKFVANETNGLYMSDECFKMALTDAISVSCKLLGIGADIYWNKSDSKYLNKEDNNKITTKQLEELAKSKHVPLKQLIDRYIEETGKKCTGIEFISLDKKKQYYDELALLP